MSENPTAGTMSDPIELSDRGVQELVCRFATRLLSARNEEREALLVECLEETAQAFDLDRVTAWYFTAGQGDLVSGETWNHPEYRLVLQKTSAAAEFPWLLREIRRGVPFGVVDVDQLPGESDQDAFRRLGIKSTLGIPFGAPDEVAGALAFTTSRQTREWPDATLSQLRLVAAVLGPILMNHRSATETVRAISETDEARAEIAGERINRNVGKPGPVQVVVAESRAARQALEQAESVAATPATVLLLGETGSGKEVFAQTIHRLSEFRRRPMVTVNCAAIPATLIESELFGRERGAYTGALARQIGRFELANGSTIFLDEIGDLPLEAQVKLLRVLQERVVERLGSNNPIKVDVRIIAATNRNLEQAVADKSFREDLYYRLNVFPITVPPLRDRKQDIPGLVWAFIEEFATGYKKPIESISKESLAALQRYDWPGNVRELRNVIERAIIVAHGTHLVVEPPRPSFSLHMPASTRLVDFEAAQIRGVLERVGWRVRGSGGAAELLGINPNTLDSRMAKLGIKRPTA